MPACAGMTSFPRKRQSRGWGVGGVVTAFLYTQKKTAIDFRVLATAESPAVTSPFSGEITYNQSSLRQSAQAMRKIPRAGMKISLDYSGTRPCLTAYLVSSAVVRTPNSSINRYLWNSTVLVETLRRAAISLRERPSATNCSTSCWRGVSLAANCPGSGDDPRNALTIALVTNGVT